LRPTRKTPWLEADDVARPGLSTILALAGEEQDGDDRTDLPVHI